MDNIFYQLALVLMLASSIGFVVYKLKLPLVVSYLLAGLLLSIWRLFDIGHSPVFEVLPEIGIAFVLFLIGMELNLNELKVLGKPIFAAAVGQILISTFLGFGISRLLGFGSVEALYLGLGLAFSSTVVVIKMLLESRDLGSLYGKLSVGILLVEDLVAIIVLMLISVSSSALSTGLTNSFPIMMLVLKAAGLFILTFVLSKYLLSKIFEFTARSIELLFITSITWCFTFTSLAVLAGFSVEIGAFLAGVALASSPYHYQIQAKIKPMRDFFVALFFIYLGSTAQFKDLGSTFPIILIFTFFALVIKPLVYMFLLGRFGFKKHTMFQAALNLSQVSEFSLIVLLVGVNSGLIEPITISVMAAVAVLSITVSSTLISFSGKIYKKLSDFIGFFEKKDKAHFFENKSKHSLSGHIIVIGAHRVGGPIVNFLHDNEIPFVVMDFNPSVVSEMSDRGINAVYGDIGDPEIIEVLGLESAKLVICTASDFSDNQLLLNIVKEHNKKAVVVLRAVDAEHVKILKALGADYVLLPEKVSGDFIVSQLKNHWPEVKFEDQMKLSRKAVSSIV